MGIQNNITISKFPDQGTHLNKRVVAIFKYDLANRIEGLVVRDDINPPFRTIIKLDDGRYVLSTECQYSIIGVKR